MNYAFWKKILILIIIMLFVGSSSISLGQIEKNSINTNLLSRGDTLYVGGSGPNNYTNIQDAIDDANPEDTVFVYHGTYYEHVVVNKNNINLIAESTSTIIDGDGIGDVITVTSDGVTISGFTVVDSGGSNESFERALYGGIKLYCSNDNTITNNLVLSNYIGIYLDSSSNNIIIENHASNNLGGVYLRNLSNDNTIIGNIATSNIYDGIGLSHSSNNNLTGNKLTNNQRSGSIILYSCNNNTMLGNNASNNDVGIILGDSTNNLIKGNTLNSNTYEGIILGVDGSCNNNTITGNTVRYNEYGIAVSDSNDNIFMGNNVSNNNYGIGLQKSRNNTITGNTANSNNDDCIVLGDDSSNNLISENNASKNGGRGILIISASSNNIVIGNIAIKNSYGIVLSYSSNNNIIIENTANLNTLWGIFILESSNNNHVYHNNFINNTNNAADFCNNTWDNGYPSGGNYWSDYNGTDSDGDGIGDTPYNISGSNQDHYPFIEPNGWVNEPPDFQFNITGGFGVNLKITNKGTAKSTTVNWQIHVEGGIFGMVNKTINGTVDIPPGETKTVGTGIFLGLGPIAITAKVADEEKVSAEGTQLLIFSIIK